MRVAVETTGELERTATIAVPSADFEAEVAARLKIAAGDLKLPGFRPGRVPMKEVRRRLGPSTRNQAAREMAIASFSEAMREQPFTLATQAQIQIDNLSPGEDLEFTATFEVLPDVQLAPLEALDVRRPRTTIEEADIDFTIEEIRRQRREWVAVERPVQEGDRVVLDVVWKHAGVEREQEGLTLVLDEQVPSGPWREALIGLAANDKGRVQVGTAAATAAETADVPPAPETPLSLGDEPPPAPVVAGLEGAEGVEDAEEEADAAAPTGQSAPEAPSDEPGEQEDSAPSDRAADGDAAPAPQPALEESTPAHAESLAKRTTVCEFTVRSVEAPELPAVDDALFDWFGVAAGDDRLAQFRAAVRERMEVELQAATRRAITQEVVTALVEAHPFEVPPTLVQAETTADLQRIAEAIKEIPPELAARSRLLAEQKLRARLVMREIVSRQSMTPDDQRIAGRIDEIVSAYEEAAEVRRMLYRDEDKMREIETAVLEEQVIDHVLSQAQISAVDMPYRDLVVNRRLPKRPAPAVQTASRDDDQDPAPASETAPTQGAAAPTGLLGKVKRLFAKRD